MQIFFRLIERLSIFDSYEDHSFIIITAGVQEPFPVVIEQGTHWTGFQSITGPTYIYRQRHFHSNSHIWQFEVSGLPACHWKVGRIQRTWRNPRCQFYIEQLLFYMCNINLCAVYRNFRMSLILNSPRKAQIIVFLILK